ncbi:MAG TPA: class I SAM-dependent methyltransferase [Pyrinomonadaceae bacterium]|nr:class I SAM-dependent methyltransferase [Pyrinomonadaceae bacterium]
MTSTVERFSNRVENYVKYRPGYPDGVIGSFRDEMGLTTSSVVADIGSGTGISAKIFLDNGNEVYCIEPNAGMRSAAESDLGAYPKFNSRNATAENTTLADDSMDFVIAAQAFHWFDPEPTRAEFKRVLKPGGYVALIWNERQLDTTPFLREYEQFLLKFSNDYTKVRHENVNAESLTRFFAADYRQASFDNVQIFDFEGLKGRVSSSSYMPSESDPNYDLMAVELKTLFAKHAENDRISVFYDTNVFYTQY